MRLVLKLREKFFPEKRQAFAIDHSVIVEAAIMLVQTRIELDKPTVRTKFKTL